MTPMNILMAACKEDVEYEWKWEEGIEIVNIFIRCPPWHTNGDNVGLSLDRVFQFEDRDIILKGRRLVVLVDHHAFHLNKKILIHIDFLFSFLMSIDHIFTFISLVDIISLGPEMSYSPTSTSREAKNLD